MALNKRAKSISIASPDSTSDKVIDGAYYRLVITAAASVWVEQQTFHTFSHLQSATAMASTSQAHPSFPPRSTYATANKLPDRTALNNNPPPFGSSSLTRRPDQQNQPYSQPAPPPQQHGQGGRQQQQEKERESNALNELSEEQREEINEAVCSQICKQVLHDHLFSSDALFTYPNMRRPSDQEALFSRSYGRLAPTLP